MNGFLITLHVIMAVLLIGCILLQPGAKGGGLSATFGGGGANSAFGAAGAAPMLAKVTYWLAGLFLATSVFIEYGIIKENRSVLEKAPITRTSTPAGTAPQAPASSTPAAPAGSAPQAPAQPAQPKK